jgi:hypothetical protein
MMRLFIILLVVYLAFAAFLFLNHGVQDFLRNRAYWWMFP